MVGHNLKGGKERRNKRSPEQLSAIAEYNAGNRGRNKGQGHHFPNVPRRNNDAEVRGEGPDDRAQGRQPRAEIEGAQ